MVAEQQETKNTQLVSQLFDAFKRGDIAFILERATDDIRWYNHFDPIVPWAGSYDHRIADFFKEIDEHSETLAFEPTEYIAQGDTVVALGNYEVRAKSTGRAVRTKWNFVFKIRDGKVYSFEQFHDPAIATIFRN